MMKTAVLLVTKETTLKDQISKNIVRFLTLLTSRSMIVVNGKVLVNVDYYSVELVVILVKFCVGAAYAVRVGLVLDLNCFLSLPEELMQRPFRLILATFIKPSAPWSTCTSSRLCLLILQSMDFLFLSGCVFSNPRDEGS